MLTEINNGLPAVKQFFIMIGFLIVFLILDYYLIALPRKNKIRKNHIVVCADIISYSGGYKFSDLKFHFVYKGKNYEFTGRNTPHSIGQSFANGKKNILIVFQSDNIDNWNMLINNADFINYNIQPKDTSGISCNLDQIDTISQTVEE